MAMDIIREYDNMQKIAEKILEVLNIKFEAEKRFGKSLFFISDLFLPDGGRIGQNDISKQSCIEFKLRLMPTTISTVYSRFRALKKRCDLNKLYIVYKESPDERTLVNIEKEIEGLNDLVLLSFTELFEDNNPIEVENKNLTWKEERDNYRIPLLIKDIKNNSSTLFLGAGVGQSAKLPSWNELLKKIFQKSSFAHLYETDIDKITEACYNSNLITARYLTQKLKDKNKELCKAIHDIFYMDSKPQYSELMKSIVALSAKEPVKSIITYNFDDLIDQRIPNSHPMYGKRRISNTHEFPIYHVHGYVPEKNVQTDSEVILSEESYHEKYREVFDWSNVEQLYALSHSTCLFIGLSMSDPNLRRLLDIAKRNYVSDEQDCLHYAFLKRASLNGCNMPCGYRKNDEHIAILERIFQELGITVIWYEKYDDLPDILNTIISKI